jgi:hypothetical protein
MARHFNVESRAWEEQCRTRHWNGLAWDEVVFRACLLPGNLRRDTKLPVGLLVAGPFQFKDSVGDNFAASGVEQR